MPSNPMVLHRSKSHELLKVALKSRMKQFDESSTPARSTVYQWIRSPRPTGTGSRNPLDHIESLIQAADSSGKTKIAQWICLAANGFFIPGPNAELDDDSELFKHSSQLIQEFAKMIETLAETARDGRIECHEAIRIREVWQKIQSITEGYVRQCEKGKFDLVLKEIKGVRLKAKAD